MPLPLLSKMLGHKQMETTAQYYWQNIYHSDYDRQEVDGREPLGEPRQLNRGSPKNFLKDDAPLILAGQELTAKMNILNAVKDKRYWREYNARRKKYLSQKNKERYEKNKLGERVVMAPPCLPTPKRSLPSERAINTIANTTYAQQLANPFKSADPPKSRLEISR